MSTATGTGDGGEGSSPDIEIKLWFTWAFPSPHPPALGDLGCNTIPFHQPKPHKSAEPLRGSSKGTTGIWFYFIFSSINLYLSHWALLRHKFLFFRVHLNHFYLLVGLFPCFVFAWCNSFHFSRKVKIRIKLCFIYMEIKKKIFFEDIVLSTRKKNNIFMLLVQACRLHQPNISSECNGGAIWGVPVSWELTNAEDTIKKLIFIEP